MAFIYRYQLRDPNLRKKTSLEQYRQEILVVLEKNFGKNLKDSLVEEKYFEFRLYATSPMGVLQGMGCKLKASLPKNGFNGFVRMKQTLYALVYSSKVDLKDNHQMCIEHIEFIDSMLLDKSVLFMERANIFFDKKINGQQSEKVIADYKEDIKKYYSVDEVKKNYYIDILETHIENHSVPNFFSKYYKDKKNINDVRCFLIKGIHRRIENNGTKKSNKSTDDLLQLESCFDIGFINYIEKNDGSEATAQSYKDYLKINVAKERSELVEKINSELRLLISQTESIEALESIKENPTGKTDSYLFKVYNVGQALASSLSYEDDKPFLYFDYGMPFGKWSFTRPKIVKMPTRPGTSIILSHVHQDHWFRLADELNAYQCHWYIPNQKRKAQFNHKLAEIIKYGGSVQLIKSDVVFPFGRLTCAGCSKIEPVRTANDDHETGLTLRIKAQDSDGEEINILIAGDQDYDYVIQSQLDNLDILVASHHGFKYCWSTRGCVPTAKNAKTSKVIYSYGNGVTYQYRYARDYYKANWIQEYHTKKGDYEKDIYI